MFSAVQFLNVLILTLLCNILFNLVKLTELPSVWERAAYSAYDMSVHPSLLCLGQALGYDLASS